MSIGYSYLTEKTCTHGVTGNVGQIEVYHCEFKYITFVLLQALPADKHIM
jgi:hypothetical protein